MYCFITPAGGLNCVWQGFGLLPPPHPTPHPPHTQAIQAAWELSTRVFALPPERVWVSVYEQDDEAFALWRDMIGVPPERIKRMGAADNFWASGPTGRLGRKFGAEWGLEGGRGGRSAGGQRGGGIHALLLKGEGELLRVGGWLIGSP